MILEKVVVGNFQVNCYIVICEETKETIVIDPGEDLYLIEKVIKKHNGKLKYIVLTHGHGDHIGAVLELKEKYGVDILASEDEDELLKNAEYNESIRVCGRNIEINADIFAKENQIFDFGKLSFRTIKTPGHTKGGMCILIDNHIFVGDTLFRTSVGRADLYGGNMRVLVSSIVNKLFVLDENTIVYPGHGPVTSIGYEQMNNPFI